MVSSVPVNSFGANSQSLRPHPSWMRHPTWLQAASNLAAGAASKLDAACLCAWEYTKYEWIHS